MGENKSFYTKTELLDWEVVDLIKKVDIIRLDGA